MQIPLSLYIHIPWCIRKCPYCDFNSHTLRGNLPEIDYVEQLKQEFTQKLSLIDGRCINSIFIGGGTPSLLSANAYQDLLQHLRQSSNLSPNAEITLEANPGSIEQQRFNDYYQVGINRLSIGVQSLQNTKLKQLGRIHDRNTALQAIETAKQAGFTNFNVDLMFGLSQQSIADALQDLKEVMQTQATHLSWYQLTLEPNTLFYKHPPILPDDDALWDMQLAGQKILAKHGYQQYEVSAYSKGNLQCQHNVNYWLFGDYLGIGAGAHSKITDREGNITRHSNIKHPARYLKDNNKISSHHTLTPQELPLEFMLNALRLYQEIPITLFEERTGLDRHVIEKTINQAIQQQFLSVKNDCLLVSDRGKQYLNNVLMLFM